MRLANFIIYSFQKIRGNKSFYSAINSLDDMSNDFSNLFVFSVVGTSSLRRSAQLKKAFPHLIIEDVVSLRKDLNYYHFYRLSQAAAQT